jgi:23S rRNA pseudouridine955/2504/2580 synthase/23S rRNA pseudouridine1911/1915/1917 synthase
MKDNLFDTLYIDEDIIVISKKAGVLTIQDRYNQEIPNLRQILKEMYGDIFVVHRLDKDTSGAMIFARNAASHKNLNEQMMNNSIKKIYHCIVTGVVQQDSFDIDIPIIHNSTKPNLSLPSARGKASLTKIKVLKRFRIASLLECELVTGRHHQIRVHCATVGHPLFIDPDYGKQSEFFLSSIKRKYHLNKNEVEKPIMNRVSLHSKSIAFNHPKNSLPLFFDANYPKDFSALLNILTKYSQIYK